MYYFVIGANGSRYGPADIDTLVQWVGEGRIVATTMLIERGTERQMPADSISAVAAALRRTAGGGAGVAIERDEPAPGELPTATRASPGTGAEHRRPPLPPIPPAAVQPIPYAQTGGTSARSKVVAGLLGIFLGGFGIHRFYLGYTGMGILQIVVTVATCGAGSLWGFIEGIVCLCGGMCDADGRELSDG